MNAEKLVGKTNEELTHPRLANIEFKVVCMSAYTGMLIVEFITGGNPKVGYYHADNFKLVKNKKG